jgi:putative endonuclease
LLAHSTDVIPGRATDLGFSRDRQSQLPKSAKADLGGASPESIIPGGAVMYYVYILASRKHGTLYIGVTNDLVRRIHQHKTNAVRGFTARYGVYLLVWFERYDDVLNAIAREKELKKWHREWKINLVVRSNPEWVDLYPGTQVR